MPTLVGAVDPGIEWREAEGNPYEPGGKAWRGPDAVVQNLFMRLAAEWDGFTVHPGEFHDAGPVVVVEARSGHPGWGAPDTSAHAKLRVNLSYADSGLTTLVTTQRCLPIFRFRVKPSFS
jgi:hypothetical protein